jgi:uncharacterized repeat protein (TIGR01451 family)
MDDPDGTVSNIGGDEFDAQAKAGGHIMDSEGHQYPDPPATSQNKREWVKNYLKQLAVEKPDRHIELALTLAISFFAAAQLIVSCSNNASTSRQSERMLQSANRIDDAADSFSRSANGINQRMSDAVTQLTTQAAAMDKSRVSSENQSTKALQAAIDNSHRDERAWVGISRIQTDPTVVQAGKTFVYLLDLSNTGRTPAKNVHGFMLTDPQLPGHLPDFSYSTDAPFKAGTILPSTSISTVMKLGIRNPMGGAELTPKAIERFAAGDIDLFVHGIVYYEDIFHAQHWTSFCFKVARDFAKYDACATHNDTDDK